MDSLDFNLHQAILSSLAKSHSTERQREKRKAESQDTPVVNGADSSSSSSVPDFLQTFGITQEEVQGGTNWRLGAVNAAIAACEYQSEVNVSEVTQDDALENGLFALLGRLQTLELERCLGAQGGQAKWLLADQLAYHLARVAITSKNPKGVETLFDSYSALKTSLELTEPSRTIEHVLPCLHGMHRAVHTTTALWTNEGAALAVKAASSLTERAAANLTSTLTGSFVNSSSDGKAVLSVLARYANHSKPMTANFVDQLDATLVRDITVGLGCQTRTSPLVGWERMRSGSIEAAALDMADKSPLGQISGFAHSALTKTIQALQQGPPPIVNGTPDMDGGNRSEYDIDIVSRCLETLAAVGWMNKPNGELLALLGLVLSDQSPAMILELHITALRCVDVLVRRHAEIAQDLTDLLRKYITTPLSVFWSEEGGHPSQVLLNAASSLAVCVDACGNDDQAMATVYSLLNYLPSSSLAGDASRASIRSSAVLSNDETGGMYGYHALTADYSQEEKAMIVCSTVYTVSALAQYFERKEIVKLVLGMLLQRIRNSEFGLNGQDYRSPWQQAINGVSFMGVANLAPQSSDTDFTETAKAFTETARSRHLLSDHDAAAMLRSVQLHCVSNLKDRPELIYIYLREQLILFIDQSLPTRGEGQHRSVHQVLHKHHPNGHTISQDSTISTDRTDTLRQVLETLTVLDAVHALPTFAPHMGSSKDMPEDLVLLYRNMWLLATCLGLTSPADKDTQLHRAILKRIAIKTPCILRGTPLNYTETELEYNPILRREHGASSEAMRTELASILNAGNSMPSRSYSYPQTVFLLTVARLESYRAESGDPSIMLEYFHNEGINNSTLSAPLMEVSEKVTGVFNRSLGEKVRMHAVRPAVSQRIQAMVLQCCHAHKQTRQAAVRSLDSIFTAFPVTLCDSPLLTCILESLTLLRNACECEMDDEYAPAYDFHSERAGITLVLPDDYDIRNAILATLHKHTRQWLTTALSAAPAEMIGLLENYLDNDKTIELRASSSMGHGVALEMARQMPISQRESGIPDYGGWRADTSALFSSTYGTRHTYGSEAKTVIGLSREDGSLDTHHIQALRDRLRDISENLRLRKKRYTVEELRPVLYRAAAVIMAKAELDYGLLREIVFIPVHAVNPSAMHLGVEVWAWLVDRRADVEQKLMVDLHLAWSWTVRRRRGLFSVLLRAEDPINSKTEYSPTDIAAISKASRTVKEVLTPHRYLLGFLSSRFQAYRYRDRELVLGCMRFVIRSCQRYRVWGKHPLCRELRTKVVTLGFSILSSTQLEASLERTFRLQLYAAALSWFEEAPTWSYGADRLQLQEDIRAMQRLLQTVREDGKRPFTHVTTRQLPSDYPLKYSQDKPDKHASLQQLLVLHLENEVQRLAVWTNPLDDARRGKDPPISAASGIPDSVWTDNVRAAWAHSPRLAVLMADRFKVPVVHSEVQRLVQADPSRAAQVPEALDFFLGKQVSNAVRPHLKHLVHWAPVSPISALRYFLPAFNKEPLVLQYAMRVLEQHPVDLVFFYIPQVVQALRTDPLHYMERFIFETSKISQLFCHQMIWNMKANCYKDDLAEVSDPDKAQFERMVDLIIESLSGEAKDFYEKEFGFFNEVTSISRKLMPYVKKSKPEKKEKIDEEMAKIKVEKGVYLPSHPEGQVIDIDRHSGRPLQSHAKTPFMATFQVTKEYEEEYSEDAITAVGGEHTLDDGKDGGANEGFPSLQGGESGKPRVKSEETKLSAIFKVGDDCRQDVLAMQVIAQFKNIFNVFGLDLQVQPYRVLATGPGTGIIDVVPNATSRDEMGRAKINDLTSFFLFQFGPVESVAFQKARNNFIQSMAAYSVLCYILQIKDRHNGNIMIDGTGRITHIDFGFLFDIGPGGIKFEPNSFKLTHEMITLMGGKTSQGYRQFCELTVKAFLSCRAYVEDVVSTCQLMMPTDLPSFKGEGTMIRLRDRFKPDLTEREAAKYMQGVIDNACENSMSIVYDQFQYFQNKIPYAS